ncbi:winged helix-turn-helix domain-containing protein [Halococcus agarilyticus]|uniref:winged helix-turn-helix domain-containing protein n=1 Tax=Halococcus agarilyticus TaxID=1232219 RepID=UPI000677DE8B|nr:helix-turn-helix domain-containing protein [Halococcus agarilyticus]
MTTDGDLSEVAELLDDPYARAILAKTSIEPMSAKMLSDRCDASLPTVYRRIERLQEHDLLREQQQLDPDGHHYKSYEARLEQVSIDLEDGTYSVEITRTEREAADRFSDLVEELK